MLQHGGVGSLKQPLLAGGGRLAGVHEDAALAGAAVDAAVADRVVQALVLQTDSAGSDAEATPTAFIELKRRRMQDVVFIHCLFNSMAFLLAF